VKKEGGINKLISDQPPKSQTEEDGKEKKRKRMEIGTRVTPKSKRVNRKKKRTFHEEAHGFGRYPTQQTEKKKEEEGGRGAGASS
jgi:hypothetical protein